MAAEKEQTGQPGNNADFNINTDENISGSTHLNDAVSEGDELEKALQQAAEYKDKYLRGVAEFDNFRKRTAKERLELIQTANKETIISLLEVLDDAERASKQLETADNIAAVKDGISLVFNKLKNTMTNKGLKAMESIGQEFNPDLHEAITEIPAPGKEGKVIDEMQKGYYLNDKLIRHARVVVGK